ncbi:MAG: phosphotransferase [Opitutaceae bacterium]
MGGSARAKPEIQSMRSGPARPRLAENGGSAARRSRDAKPAAGHGNAASPRPPLPKAEPSRAAADGSSPDLLERLRRDGVPLGRRARASPLAGGVSSDILLVRDGRRRFVVKRALAKLRVAQDWRSDPDRNRFEQRYLRYVGALAPGAVPRILFGSEDAGYFAMEHLGAGFRNWKNVLLRGDFDPRPARRAMRLLARIHAASRGRGRIARDFATVRNFRALRTDPYLRTAARLHPRLSACLRREASRLERTRLCLVHGDFSPKNLLVGRGRVVLLDSEVACYGDPAFDVAFLLHHLCLKALYHARESGRNRRAAELQAGGSPTRRAPVFVRRGAEAVDVPGLERLFDEAATSYFGANPLGADHRAARETRSLDRRAARLTLMLLLARIDGKSPVDYLTEAKREFVRRFVSARLPAFDGTLGEVRTAWFAAVARAFPARDPDASAGRKAGGG